MKKTIMILAAVVLLASCVGRSAHDTQVSGADSLISCSSNKITTADVQIVVNEIIYNGSSYSGQVWSLDEKKYGL